MRPTSHIIAAGIMAAPVYAATSSLELTATFCISSVAMDVDHIVDYMAFGKRPLSATKFFKSGTPSTWSRMIFAAHSYEFILLMLLFSISFSSSVILAVTAGCLAHLLMDEAGNRMPWKKTRIKPFFYFFAFRFANGFRPERMSFRQEAST